MRPQRVAFVTLGCEKNAVDSEVMAGLMGEAGYAVTSHAQDADVIVVNTCAFIEAAKAESIETILRMAKERRPGAKLIVAGCMAQRYADDLLAEIPEIDGIVGTGEFTRVAEAVQRSRTGERPKLVGNPVYLYDETTPRRLAASASAYIKIAEGCDHACTFCVIPAMRGAFRSRPIESVVAEAQALVSRGVRELCLIAQDSTQYGLDVYGRRRLPDLLRSLGDVPGLGWIRLHYAYPGFFTDDVIAALRDVPQMAKYVDMPLQHSEDHILRAMRRPGRQARIRALIERIREQVPDVALRSSFIVGFPGESEEDFERLKAFVREIGFDRVGVFAYSAEEGALSADFPDQVGEEEKDRRVSELMEVAREVSAHRLQRLIGRTLSVLVEGRDAATGEYIGRTQYDAREIDGVVHVRGDGLPVGEMVAVRITHALEFDLIGEASA